MWTAGNKLTSMTRRTIEMILDLSGEASRSSSRRRMWKSLQEDTMTSWLLTSFKPRMFHSCLQLLQQGLELCLHRASPRNKSENFIISLICRTGVGVLYVFSQRGSIHPTRPSRTGKLFFKLTLASYHQRKHRETTSQSSRRSTRERRWPWQSMCLQRA